MKTIGRSHNAIGQFILKDIASMHRLTLIPCLSLLALAALFTPPCSGGCQAAVTQQTRSASNPAEKDLAIGARAAYERGDSAQARTLFLEILHTSPQNYEANETVGLIHAEANELDQALPYFQTAVRADPLRAIGYANLGAALLRLGKDREGTDALGKAVEINPQDAQGQANYARALLKTKDFTQAAKHFSDASALISPDADLLYDWALALYETEPTGSVEVLSRIRPASLNDQTESLYGDAEEKIGHYTESVRHLRHAVALSPSEGNIYSLAVELLRHWSWQEAAEVCHYGRSGYPKSTRLAMAEGVAQFGNGNYRDASATFSALLESSPNSVLYGDMLGRTCDAMPDMNGSSCDLLQQFAASHPGNARIDVYAASSILRSPEEKQDLERAGNLLAEAVRNDPKASDAYYQLGVLDQQKLRWADSVGHLQHAIALRPAFAEAHYRLSRAYFRLGDKDHGNEEIALQRRYQAQEKEELDRKLKEVTRFIFKVP